MCVCVCSPIRGMSTHVKELTAATRVMQSSSNKLITSVSVNVHGKQTETFITYTLNSLAYVPASGILHV